MNSSARIMPSDFLKEGLEVLRVRNPDNPRFAEIASMADNFQRQNYPGRPSVTMATFLFLYKSNMKDHQGYHIGILSLARAFDCSASAIKMRRTQILRS